MMSSVSAEEFLARFFCEEDIPKGEVSGSAPQPASRLELRQWHSLHRSLRQLCREHQLHLAEDLFTFLASNLPYVERYLRGGLGEKKNPPEVDACGFSNMEKQGGVPSQRVLTALLRSCVRSAFRLELDSSERGALRPIKLSDLPVSSENGVVRFVPLGCAVLESCLGGGWRPGWVHDLVGEAGSGKTQLVLQSALQYLAEGIAARLLPRNGDNPVFFDANGRGNPEGNREGNEGGFSCVYLASEEIPAARLAPLALGAIQRIRRRCGEAFSRYGEAVYVEGLARLRAGLTVGAVLQGLKIRKVHSLEEIDGLLRSGLLASVIGTGNHNEENEGGGGILIVDSIAAAAAGSRAGVEKAASFARGGGWQALLSRVGAELRQQAASHRWVVLITNQVRAIPAAARAEALPARIQPPKRPRRGFFGDGESGEEWAPALGIRWMVTPHVRVLLQKRGGYDQGEGVPGSNAPRLFTLLSSPAVAPAQVAFKITQYGIEAGD
ncbi:unnamed protein product [Phytomonas sp. EM1]|nr:unnamed protein product [Phytomonas sp. EM1]|eukprot:CCW59567.1 unnamed protein product [Phytomonas sp. isolate EM1]